MAGELLAGLSAFKAMLDLAKGLKDINDSTARNAVAIELQEKILAAHAQQAALVEKVGELEKVVARFETWEREKQRYRLKELVPGLFAYALKRTETNGEPAHALCANCYERGVKSILQDNKKSSIFDHALECPFCKAAYRTRGQRPGELLTD
jgi:hypothetical protein